MRSGLWLAVVLGIGFWTAAVFGQTLQQQARDSCRQRMPVTAGLVHQMWVLEGPRGQRPSERLPYDMGAALSAVLTVAREDPALAAMTKDEFIYLAIRICEPIYELYFEHLSRRQHR